MSTGELYAAIRKGNAAAIKKQIEATFGSMSRKEREQLLMRAALPDTWDVRPIGWLVHFLLAQGVSPDTRTDARVTYPFPSGLPLVHALARAFTHPDARASRSPGKTRAANKLIEVAAMSFVERGANLGPSKPQGDSVLHAAARHGAVLLVAACIRRGADVNAKNKRGETPLFEAARSNNVAVVKRLITAGATNVRNKHGETAHDIAIAEGSKKTAALLAKVFPREQRLIGGALSKQDVARLLQRLAKDRHSIYCPSGKPDPALAKVLTGGRVEDKRVHLHLDTKRLPEVSPSIKKELLVALGHEGLRWLNSSKIDTRGYDVGAAKPWYMTAAKSLKRAEKLVAQISGHRN